MKAGRTTVISRRERALYTVLLHGLRGMAFADDEVDAFHVRAVFGVDVCGETLNVYDRLVRVRLALYLRALLRADAGDLGPWYCKICGRSCAPNYGRDRWYCSDEHIEHLDGFLHYSREGSRRVRPLWESARNAIE